MKQNYLDFEQYEKQKDLTKKESCYAWQTAFGLQAVDGLTPSDYLVETAKRQIEGEITVEEVRSLINTYYESKTLRNQEETDEQEADQVSINIRHILESKAFTFSIVEFLGIHEQIFHGVFKHAGRIRTYNITKKEWVLDNDTVFYANHEMIQKTLEYDFEKERNFDYSGLSKEEVVKHISRFFANIWQVHPFSEGNTRTTAVFAIKYLNSLGFPVTNDTFIKNSWYFRNALVRANYSNVRKGISMNTEYLEKFFENVLFDKNNLLLNRNLHINANENLPVNLSVNLPVNKTEAAIMVLLKKNPHYTYEELAKLIGKTRETVRVNLRKLEARHKIERVGSDKTGYWKVF